jgi:hypothetical protein
MMDVTVKNQVSVKQFQRVEVPIAITHDLEALKKQTKEKENKALQIKRKSNVFYEDSVEDVKKLKAALNMHTEKNANKTEEHQYVKAILAEDYEKEIIKEKEKNNSPPIIAPQEKSVKTKNINESKEVEADAAPPKYVEPEIPSDKKPEKVEAVILTNHKEVPIKTAGQNLRTNNILEADLENKISNDIESKLSKKIEKIISDEVAKSFNELKKTIIDEMKSAIIKDKKVEKQEKQEEKNFGNNFSTQNNIIANILPSKIKKEEPVKKEENKNKKDSKPVNFIELKNSNSKVQNEKNDIDDLLKNYYTVNAYINPHSREEENEYVVFAKVEKKN